MPVLSVYREYGVILKDSRDDNHNATSLDTSNYKVVRPGDLAVNKMKAWQGSLGVSEHHGIVFVKEGAAELLSVNMNDPQPTPVLELIAKTKRLDGIRFHSSKVDGANSDCFVLFCDHEESAEI